MKRVRPLRRTRAAGNVPSDLSRALLAHRFYAPDITTYSQMLAMMATQLKLDGFTVSVFTTQPSYNGVYDGPSLPKKRVEDGVSVIRTTIPGGSSSIGRLLGGVVFGLRLILHAATHRKKYDVIMVSTVPPVLMGMCGRLAAKLANAKLVYHCMDLYPEIALASGAASPGPLARLAQTLDSRTIAAASKTVVLSNDMKQTIADRGAPTDRVIIQNNFTIDSADASSEVALPPELEASSAFRLLFAGNIGRFQGLDTLLEAFDLDGRNAGGSPTEMVLLGTGAAKASLIEQADSLGLANGSGHQVRFVDHQPLEVAMQAMTVADLAIVSLAPDLIRSAYPSKTVMYLEMGCRILAIVEPESELAKLIVDNDLGSVAAPGDVAGIAEAIAAERARTPKPDDRDRSRAIAEREFAAESVLPKWSDIIGSIGANE